MVESSAMISANSLRSFFFALPNGHLILVFDDKIRKTHRRILGVGFRGGVSKQGDVSGWKALVRGTKVLRMADLSSMPTGELLCTSFFSQALGERRFVGLYQTSGAPLPRLNPVVISLFPGHCSQWSHSPEDGSASKHRADDTDCFVELLQEKVTAGLLPPCLVLLPDVGGEDLQGLTLTVERKKPALADEGVTLDAEVGTFETSYRWEFMPRIEESLGLWNPRRVAIGFCLGGLNACQLALRNPGLFSVVACYDGSFPYHPFQANDPILRHPLFDLASARLADPAKMKAHSPVWLAQNLPLGQLHRTRFFLASGPEWAEPGDANYYRNQQLVCALLERGVHNGCGAVVEGGHHDWETAARFAMDVLTMVLGTETSRES